MIPWRYIIPRGGYFKSLLIARRCPEILHHIDMAAFYAGASVLGLVAILTVVLPLRVISWVADALADMASTDFVELRNREIEAAHRVLNVDQIRERCGFDPLPRISPKRKEN